LDAVAIETVMEVADGACADAAAARAALAASLASARAPKRQGGAGAWRVHLRIERGIEATRTRTRTRSGVAAIVDDAGELVAERTVGDRAEACTPLARAVAAWASLVLDDESARARDAAEPSATPTSEPVAAPILRTADAEGSSRFEDREDVPARPRDARTVEIGLMAYVRDGLAATSGFAGASPFVNVELASGWFLRPALAFGSSTARVPTDIDHRSALVHIGGRSDFCRRIPGNYIERRGIELDLCVGAEIAEVSARSRAAVSPSAMRSSAGPSAALRGELGAHTNLELRLAGGYNFARAPLDAEGAAPAIYGALEVGLSWRLR
jgi:hypothetical protein